LAKYPQVSEKQKENVKKIIVLIDMGKYTNLQSDVDRLEKKKLNLNAALTELDKIAKQYNVDLSDAKKGKKGRVEKPVLIISESFE
jgi:predicted  nucleic acid-binding Zn-ribbon protein